MLCVDANFPLVLLAERGFFPTKPRPFEASLKKFVGTSIWHPLGNFFVADVHRTAPYEKRIIELLRNNKDKRARKLAKNRVIKSHQKNFVVWRYSWEHFLEQRERWRNFRLALQKLDALVINGKLWDDGIERRIIYPYDISVIFQSSSLQPCLICPSNIPHQVHVCCLHPSL